MKNLIVLLSFISTLTFASNRVIEIKTEKVGDAVHWMPEKIKVTAGEKVTFKVEHKLQGGFDFHGFFLPVLKISEKIDRDKVKNIDATIPKDLKAGEYPVGCHFHPKHIAATLVVEDASKH